MIVAPGAALLLNKALFYLDLYTLRDQGKLLTECEYIALPAGPTVASYERRLVRDLRTAGLAVQNERGDTKPVRVA